MSQDFLKLEPGDILGLTTDIDDELIVKVEGIPKFKGRPGVVKENRAVQVTYIVPRQGAKEDGMSAPELPHDENEPPMERV